MILLYMSIDLYIFTWNAALPVRFAGQAGVKLGKDSKKVVTVEGPVQGPAKRPRLAPRNVGLAPYAGHALATGAGLLACLKCGEVWGRPYRTSEFCPRRADELPALVSHMLGVGALNVSLLAGSAALRDAAGSWGWAAPAPPACTGARLIECMDLRPALRRGGSMAATTFSELLQNSSNME